MFYALPTKAPQLGEIFDPSNKLRCGICLRLISEVQNLAIINGITPFHTFTNPNGQTFNLMTLNFCHGLVNATPPMSEHSWFKGYDWIIELCGTCHEHLGWKFQLNLLPSLSPESPSTFWGMIKDRLIASET